MALDASRLARALAAAVACGALAGCGSDTDDRAAVWRYISPVIVQPNCATSSCHGPAAAVAGLDLSTVDDGHKSLVLTTLATNPPKRTLMEVRNLVVAGNPDQSRMVNMLRAAGARRMPPDRPLAEADIALIERWILNGAKND